MRRIPLTRSSVFGSRTCISVKMLGNNGLPDAGVLDSVQGNDRSSVLGAHSRGPDKSRRVFRLTSPSHRPGAFVAFSAFVLSLVVAGCSGSTGDQDQLVQSESGIAVSVVESPINSLSALVSVEIPVETTVEVEFKSDETLARVVASEVLSTTHDFVVVGLRAGLSYDFVATTGEGETSDVTTFVAGSLPADAPTVEILAGGTDGESVSQSDGITFFGLQAGRGEIQTGPSYYGVDSAGEVVWYLDNGEEASANPLIRGVGDGQIMAFSASGYQLMSLGGGVVESQDLSQVRGFHHDAVVLPNGNTLALTRETESVDGADVQGDVIVELGSDGETVWEWSTFDHLDTTRYPGPLSLEEGRGDGGLDWTHVNSVFFDEDTNQILLSVRSQGWVVSVDRETSEIAWIAGEREGSAITFDAPFLELDSGTWPSGQHAAMLTTDGELAVYDNRSETGGEEQMSRAVVYELDVANGTASQIFEYVASKYTSSLGDIDELGNGNLLLTAGGPGSSDQAHLIEVDRQGNLVWEASTDGRIYRSERLSWSEIDSYAASATVASATEQSASEPDTTENGEGAQAGNGEGAQAGNGERAQAGNGERAQAGNGEGAQAGNGQQGGPDTSPIEILDGATDITGVALESTEASCAAHSGQYVSTSTDFQTGTEFEGVVDISVDGDHCTIRSNQIPNHDMGVDAALTHSPDTVFNTWILPIEPTVADEPSPLSFTVNAVLLNGVIWEAYDAACFGEGDTALGTEKLGCGGGGDLLESPWRYDIGWIANGFTVDSSFAHAHATGQYHYHKRPSVLYETECSGVAESPVVGYARDAFPIYGPCFTDSDGTIRRAESSFVVKDGPRQDVPGYQTPFVVGNVSSEDYTGQFIGDYGYVEGAGDLDACNGMVVDGQYGYYLTDGFPYVLSCYTGELVETFGDIERGGGGRGAGGQNQN